MRKIWVIDFKTSKSFAGIDEYSMQLSAYLSAAHEMDLIDARERCGIGILRLDKETGMPEFRNCSDNFLKDADRFCALAHYWNLSNTYKEPKRKSKYDNSRWYDIDGKMYGSVTTILSTLHKGALVQWSANCAAEYARKRLFDIIERGEAVNKINSEEIFEKAKTAYSRVSKDATDTGTLVHDAIEAYLSKKPYDDILAKDDKAQNSFLAFLTWADEVELEPIHLEAQIHSHEHRYAGRVDFIGYCDIKEEEDNG